MVLFKMTFWTLIFVKDIHIVCKNMTRNGPKRVILKSTTNFFVTDVISNTRWISGLMPNLIKKSWTDSTLSKPYESNSYAYIFCPCCIEIQRFLLGYTFVENNILPPFICHFFKFLRSNWVCNHMIWKQVLLFSFLGD